MEQIGLLAYIYRVFEHFLRTEVSEIRSVDLFFNQFYSETTGQTDARLNPRALVEIRPLELSQRGNNIQEAVVEIVVHLGIDIFSTFRNDSEILDRNILYLTLLDLVFRKMNRISSYRLPVEIRDERFKVFAIRRTVTELATNPEATKVSSVTFEAIVEDFSATNNEIIEAVTEAVLSDVYVENVTPTGKELIITPLPN